MPYEIGELAVEQYLALTAAAARGENNPFLQLAVARHGARAPAVESARRFAGLIEEFARRFGADRPIGLYESPGRVNLMGMHIDHRGGIVNPVATQERIRAVCSRRDDDLVRARSLTGSFGEGEFRLAERLPPRPLASLGDWLDWTEHEAAARGGRHFINYFACGPLYAACFCYPWGRQFAGADFLLDSDLPPSSGMASSSAVVVLSTDVFLRCNPRGVEDLSLETLLEIYGYGEWYIGTRGGTGDQAAIKLCRRGAIQPIITTPQLRALEPAEIPPGYEIELYQSGDAANKSVEPFKTAFNAPIISYQAAEALATDFVAQRRPGRFTQLMSRRADLDARHRRVYLGDVINDSLLSENEVYAFLRTVPPTMNQAEVFALFREHAESFRAGIQQASEPAGGYHVRDVAAFGFGECARARDAASVLAEGDMPAFADMLNVSQLGDRVTEGVDGSDGRRKFLDDEALAAMQSEHAPIHELAGDYHVSTANIDRMVAICRDCPGVMAARLSGAGLGGMVIVLGREGFAETLDPILQREYYEPLGKEFHRIRIVPSPGAGVY